MKTSTDCPVCGGRLSLWTGLRAPTPFETSSAMFLPVSELSALHHAIGQAEVRIKKLRGH